jgi:phytoene dehydrogenase-like protein
VVQVDTEQNVVLISIASVADSSLAPQGKHTLHAYYPATEPYSPWASLDRNSQEYADFKEARAQVQLQCLLSMKAFALVLQALL